MAIEREVHYRVLNSKSGELAATGKTVDISSSGVLFTSEHLLLPGRSLELSIDWPAQLNDKCSLRLVARGHVVRVVDGCVALEIVQHEFRTKAKSASAG